MSSLYKSPVRAMRLCPACRVVHIHLAKKWPNQVCKSCAIERSATGVNRRAAEVLAAGWLAGTGMDGPEPLEAFLECE